MEKPNQNQTTDTGSDSDKFYAEMDKSKFHQSCCTCQTLGIFFAVLLILSIVGILSIYWQITREKVFSFKLPTISLQSFNNKLNNIVQSQSGQMSLTLSNEDMTALLAEGLSVQSFILKEIQVQILPNQMIIYGTLAKPLKSKVVIGAVPKTQDGRVVFEVISVTAGNLNSPKFLNNQIGKSLSDLVNAKLAPVYQKIEIQEINLEENKLILNGKAK